MRNLSIEAGLVENAWVRILELHRHRSTGTSRGVLLGEDIAAFRLRCDIGEHEKTTPIRHTDSLLRPAH